LRSSRIASLAGAVVVGSSSLLWSHAVVAEVYAPHLALFLAALFFLLRATSARDLALGAWFGGLSAAAHPLGIGVLPLLFIARAAGSGGMRGPRSIAGPLLLFSIPFTLFLYLPIRSALDPPTDWGNPETAGAFLAHVLRLRYQDVPRPDLSLSLFLREIEALGRMVVARNIPLPLLPLLPLGIVAAVVREGRRTVLSLGGLVLFGPLLVLALRFPLAPERVEENTVFFLPALALLALFLSTGIELLLRACSARRFLRAGMGAVLILLVAVRFASAWRAHPYDQVVLPEAYGRQVLHSLPRGAVLHAQGDDIVFPLLYLRRALGMREDVTILDAKGTVFPRRAEGSGDNVYSTFPEPGLIPSGLLFRREGASPAPAPETVPLARGEERVLRGSTPLRTLWTNYMETRARSEETIERAAFFRRAALALSEEAPDEPDRRADLYAEATVLAERRREEEAAARLSVLLSEDPRDASAALLLAEIELGRGGTEGALRLASLFGSAPASSLVRSARVHLYAGERERAREILESAARRDPLATEPIALLQGLADEAAMWEESIRLGKRALDIDPALAEVHVRLARAYRALGDARSAARAYRALLQLEPGGAGADEARRFLTEAGARRP
ncbi:MAG: tetratricopeptide repeat protein, partial [Candidatus Eisenbacteria bacterium]